MTGKALILNEVIDKAFTLIIYYLGYNHYLYRLYVASHNVMF